MDALILSCGTGGGHNSAAKAILEQLQMRGHRAVMLNPYTLKSNRLSGGIDKTYISTVQNVPRAFGAVYRMGNLYRKLPFRSPVYFVNRAMIPVIEKYLNENHFDIVIMTHLFPAEIFANMKIHGIEIPKTMFIATDYACTPFTEETKCDAYIIPAKDLTEDFAGRGIPDDRIYPLGIPTQSSFSSDISRNAARAALGLDADKKYILITGGSMGGGKMKNAIAKIHGYFCRSDDIEMIIVCGSNTALYDMLKSQHLINTTIIGHTDDMALYMKAADLFITKPGGLSSTEAAVCGVPIFHTSPIPGCESLNAQYFECHDMSISGDITETILCRIKEFLNDSNLHEKMISMQRQYINPTAAADICMLAENIVSKEQITRKAVIS